MNTQQEKGENIVCGDCRDYLDEIPADAYFITDPPYNQGYHYENYDDNLSEDEYRQMLYEIFVDSKSVIIHYPEQTLNILATLDLGELGEVVSWVYNSNTSKQHRLITWWNCSPDMRKIPQPYKNPTDKRIKKRIAEGKMARGYDWWEINQVKNVSKGKSGNIHSCPIPIKVAEKIILSTTEEGDMVVDPFCGSGTVLKAAQNLNRRFMGFDVSDRYCEFARERLLV